MSCCLLSRKTRKRRDVVVYIHIFVVDSSERVFFSFVERWSPSIRRPASQPRKQEACMDRSITASCARCTYRPKVVGMNGSSSPSSSMSASSSLLFTCLCACIFWWDWGRNVDQGRIQIWHFVSVGRSDHLPPTPITYTHTGATPKQKRQNKRTRRSSPRP